MRPNGDGKDGGRTPCAPTGTGERKGKMAKRNSRRRKFNQVKNKLMRRGLPPGAAGIQAGQLTGMMVDRLAVVKAVEKVREEEEAGDVAEGDDR